MPYSAEISRNSPTCFLFLVDRSGSMADTIGGEAGRPKADVVADAINRLLQAIVLKCSKSGGVRDYFHVGVIGYGSHVGPALEGGLAGRELVPVSQIERSPLRIDQRTRRVDDGAGGLVTETMKFPVWFEPVANGRTPMCQALHEAGGTISDFINRNRASFPPIVLNITDGRATDGDPAPIAEALRSLATRDGQTLLFNMHVSSTPGPPLQFPDNERALSDDYARMLFHMSSVLPPRMLAAARDTNPSATESSRGFIFNADSVSVVQFLEVGTTVGLEVE